MSCPGSALPAYPLSLQQALSRQTPYPEATAMGADTAAHTRVCPPAISKDSSLHLFSASAIKAFSVFSSVFSGSKRVISSAEGLAADAARLLAHF